MKRILSCLVGIMLVAPVPWASSEDYRPELTIDLAQFGYKVPDSRGQFLLSKAPDSPATFLDNQTLAISMFVQNPKPGLSRRDKVFGGDYLFQTVFLDAKSGKVVRKEQWSNATTESGLFVAPNGGFVIWHDFELLLYAEDGTVVKKFELDRKKFPISAAVKQSLSGKTLYAEASDRSGKHLLCIHTQDLEPFAWFDFDDGYFESTGSDSQFAFVTPQSRGYPPMDLFVLKLDDPDPTALKRGPIFSSPQPGCLSVTFLDDQTLGLSGECHDLTILNTSGEVLFHKSYDKEFVHRVLPCRTCSLLVSGTYVYRGGSAFLDISPKGKEENVILFDRSTGNLVEFPYPGIIKNVGSKALSPDGCLLAIQTDSMLRIYDTCDSALGTRLRSKTIQH